jgi:hypothetical protein
MMAPQVAPLLPIREVISLLMYMTHFVCESYNKQGNQSPILPLL